MIGSHYMASRRRYCRRNFIFAEMILVLMQHEYLYNIFHRQVFGIEAGCAT